MMMLNYFYFIQHKEDMIYLILSIKYNKLRIVDNLYFYYHNNLFNNYKFLFIYKIYMHKLLVVQGNLLSPKQLRQLVLESKQVPH